MVGFRDVVGILKLALHREASPVTGLAIVQESVASQQMDSSQVFWPVTEIPVTLDHDQEVNLVGVLPGDVNGRWSGS